MTMFSKRCTRFCLRFSCIVQFCCIFVHYACYGCLSMAGLKNACDGFAYTVNFREGGYVLNITNAAAILIRSDGQTVGDCRSLQDRLELCQSVLDEVTMSSRRWARVQAFWQKPLGTQLGTPQPRGCLSFFWLITSKICLFFG